jgi:hypothetical protein
VKEQRPSGPCWPLWKVKVPGEASENLGSPHNDVTAGRGGAHSFIPQVHSDICFELSFAVSLSGLKYVNAPFIKELNCNYTVQSSPCANMTGQRTLNLNYLHPQNKVFLSFDYVP